MSARSQKLDESRRDDPTHPYTTAVIPFYQNVLIFGAPPAVEVTASIG